MSTMTAGRDAPDPHELMLRRLGAPLLVKVHVKSVEQALNTPASDPINAESSPATTMPRRPGGRRYCTIIGKRPAPAAAGWPSGPICAAVPGILPLLARAKQISPGMMNR